MNYYKLKREKTYHLWKWRESWEVQGERKCRLKRENKPAISRTVAIRKPRRNMAAISETCVVCTNLAGMSWGECMQQLKL